MYGCKHKEPTDSPISLSCFCLFFNLVLPCPCLTLPIIALELTANVYRQMNWDGNKKSPDSF